MARRNPLDSLTEQDDGRRAPCPDCGEVGMVCERCHQSIARLVESVQRGELYRTRPEQMELLDT